MYFASTQGLLESGLGNETLDRDPLDGCEEHRMAASALSASSSPGRLNIATIWVLVLIVFKPSFAGQDPVRFREYLQGLIAKSVQDGVAVEPKWSVLAGATNQETLQYLTMKSRRLFSRGYSPSAQELQAAQTHRKLLRVSLLNRLSSDDRINFDEAIDDWILLYSSEGELCDFIRREKAKLLGQEDPRAHGLDNVSAAEKLHHIAAGLLIDFSHVLRSRQQGAASSQILSKLQELEARRKEKKRLFFGYKPDQFELQLVSIPLLSVIVQLGEAIQKGFLALETENKRGPEAASSYWGDLEDENKDMTKTLNLARSRLDQYLKK